MKSRSEKLIFAAIVLTLLIVQVYFAHGKQGFHEDEFYSFFSSNRTAGLFTPDREWVETESIRNEFVVLPGEGFRFALIKEIQSWDVHPPLYYQVLHAACSLFPGVFSKWIGILVNLIAFCFGLILMEHIARGLRVPFVLRLFFLVLAGCNPAIISVNLFLRMYALLTLWVLLLCCLHLRPGTEQDNKKRVWWFALIAFCDLCGFLTHYYYLILAISLFAGWTIVCYRNRTNEAGKRVLRTWCIAAASHAAGFAAAVIAYPAALTHILRGYRGREAAEAFFSLSNLFERTVFFAGVLWHTFFARGMLIAVLLIAGVVLRFWVKAQPGETSSVEKDKTLHNAILMLGVTILLYSLAVTKSALLLGDTSIRYLAPVLPLTLLLFVLILMRFLRRKSALPDTAGMRLRELSLLALPVLCLFGGSILFRYPENAERIAFDDAHRDAAVVIAYNEESTERIWWITDHILRFDRVYFLKEQNTAPITDAVLSAAEELLVFAADEENVEAQLKQLSALPGSGAKQERTITKQWQRDMWTLYRIH